METCVFPYKKNLFFGKLLLITALLFTGYSLSQSKFSVAQGQIVEQRTEVIHVSIINDKNKTQFVPDDITITTGSTIVWINNDSSDHRITVGSGSRSEYSLMNSLIRPEATVDLQFESAGTYFFSDLEYPQSDGKITVLENE